MMLSPVIYNGDKSFKGIKETNIVITSHRGAGGLAPENTLSSVKKGMDAGAQRIEIDVRQSKDNVVICMHDKSIARTTDGKGNVGELTYNQILKYSAGVKFSEAYKAEKVPTLEQVINLVAGNATLIIEIKDGDELYPGIEQRIVNLINKHNAKRWCAIHSFNDSVLIRVHQLDKEIMLHKLFIADFPYLLLVYDGNFRVTNLEYYQFVDEFSVFYAFATRRLINKVHSLNKKINVWTVNDSTKIKQLIKLGIDGVITDFPNFAK